MAREAFLTSKQYLDSNCYSAMSNKPVCNLSVYDLVIDPMDAVFG